MVYGGVALIVVAIYLAITIFGSLRRAWVVNRRMPRFGSTVGAALIPALVFAVGIWMVTR